MSSSPSKPTPQTDARLATGLFVAFAIMTTIGATYPPVPRTFPVIVGAVGTCLSVIEAVRLWRRARLTAPSAGESQRQRLIVFGWVAAALASACVLGLVVGGAIFVAVFLRVREREPWRFCLLGAAAVVGVLHGLMEMLFGLPLYRGWL
jgi:hypothetical protein